jgi:hypothetical protein
VFSSFWIISIIVSVVTLHPIILSVINPPGVRHSAMAGVEPLARARDARRRRRSSSGSTRSGSRTICSGTRSSPCRRDRARLLLFHERIYKVITDSRSRRAPGGGAGRS